VGTTCRNDLDYCRTSDIVTISGNIDPPPSNNFQVSIIIRGPPSYLAGGDVIFRDSQIFDQNPKGAYIWELPVVEWFRIPGQYQVLVIYNEINKFASFTVEIHCPSGKIWFDKDEYNWTSEQVVVHVEDFCKDKNIIEQDQVEVTVWTIHYEDEFYTQSETITLNEECNSADYCKSTVFSGEIPLFDEGRGPSDYFEARPGSTLRAEYIDSKGNFMFADVFITSDSDRDRILGHLDNCPWIGNADQADADSDGFGNVCSFDASITDVKISQVITGELFELPLFREKPLWLDVYADVPPLSTSYIPALDITIRDQQNPQLVLHRVNEDTDCFGIINGPELFESCFIPWSAVENSRTNIEVKLRCRHHEDMDCSNNTFGSEFMFAPDPHSTFRLNVVPFIAKNPVTGDECNPPSFVEIWDTLDQVEYMLPVDSIDIAVSPFVFSIIPLLDLTDEDDGIELLNFLDRIKFEGREKGSKKIALVCAPSEGAGGLAEAPGKNAWSFTHHLPATHELSHTFGVQHHLGGEGCGQDQLGTTEYYPDYPGFDRGSIGTIGHRSYQQWDFANPSTYYDYMTCFTLNWWTSEYTYAKIFVILNPNEVTSVGLHYPLLFLPAVGSSQEKFLEISGIIKNGNEIIREHARTIFLDDEVLDEQGEFSITLLDGDNSELASHFFNAISIENTQSKRFVKTIPFSEDATLIQIKKNESILKSIPISMFTPEITITNPSNSDILSGTIEVKWEGTDLDNDSLTFDVSYSKDNGFTWIPLVFGLQDSSFQLDTNLLPGGEKSIIRVYVNDGVHTSFDDSTVFVSKKEPIASIRFPEKTTTTLDSHPILFKAVGFDLEDGYLNGDSLVWSSDKDGEIGKGESITIDNLSEGKHTITLTATDSDDNTSSDSITIDVKNSEKELQDSTQSTNEEPHNDAFPLELIIALTVLAIIIGFSVYSALRR